MSAISFCIIAPTSFLHRRLFSITFLNMKSLLMGSVSKLFLVILFLLNYSMLIAVLSWFLHCKIACAVHIAGCETVIAGVKYILPAWAAVTGKTKKAVPPVRWQGNRLGTALSLKKFWGNG